MTENQQKLETTPPKSDPPVKSKKNTSTATDHHQFAMDELLERLNTTKLQANAKAKFIQHLKAYIQQEKGSHIYDQMMMDMGHLFYDQLKNGSLH